MAITDTLMISILEILLGISLLGITLIFLGYVASCIVQPIYTWTKDGLFGEDTEHRQD